MLRPASEVFLLPVVSTLAAASPPAKPKAFNARLTASYCNERLSEYVDGASSAAAIASNVRSFCRRSVSLSTKCVLSTGERSFNPVP
jgi:hypothetical protein